MVTCDFIMMCILRKKMQGLTQVDFMYTPYNAFIGNIMISVQLGNSGE